MRLRPLGLAASFCLLTWGTASLAATTATTTVTISIFAAIALSPSPLSFGSQLIGQETSAAITVKNAGTIAFSPISITLVAGTNGADFTLSNDCGASLAAGASCQISVAYLPSGADNASAAVHVSGGGRTYAAAVSGTGVTMPVAPTPVSIALSPSSIKVLDDATGGSIVSTATVTMSDGSTNFTGTLTTSDTSYYAISGLNIVLQHDLSGADDGEHDTTIGIGP